MIKQKTSKKVERGKIIRNMGLFWRREQVLWRGNKKIGRAALWGIRRGAKSAGSVDFWKQVGIYALYADYQLVYVGQVGIGDKSYLGSRLKAHTRDDLAGRWDMFSWFGLCKVNTNLKLGTRFKLANATWHGIADILEGVLIEVAEPPMNSQKGRFGGSVHRYLQASVHQEKDELNSKIAALGKVVARIEKKVDKKNKHA